MKCDVGSDTRLPIRANQKTFGLKRSQLNTSHIRVFVGQQNRFTSPEGPEIRSKILDLSQNPKIQVGSLIF